MAAQDEMVTADDSAVGGDLERISRWLHLEPSEVAELLGLEIV